VNIRDIIKRDFALEYRQKQFERHFYAKRIERYRQGVLREEDVDELQQQPVGTLEPAATKKKVDSLVEEIIRTAKALLPEADGSPAGQELKEVEGWKWKKKALETRRLTDL